MGEPNLLPWSKSHVIERGQRRFRKRTRPNVFREHHLRDAHEERERNRGAFLFFFLRGKTRRGLLTCYSLGKGKGKEAVGIPKIAVRQTMNFTVSNELYCRAKEMATISLRRRCPRGPQTLGQRFALGGVRGPCSKYHAFCVNGAGLRHSHFCCKQHLDSV